MKSLLLIFHGFDPSNGISQKIQYQLEALTDCGLDAHICYLKEDAYSKKRMVDDNVISDYGLGFKSKIKKRIEYMSVAKYVIDNNIKFVYMRSDHNASYFLINAVKMMRRHGVKVVMEIPTYPYDVEYIGWTMKKRLIQDMIFRRNLASQLNAIITFTEEKQIFGQRTICISNGVDFNSISQKQSLNDTSKELHLIGVAEIHIWHGFDRVLTGLARYYSQNPTYKVYFHIVGYFYSNTEKETILPLIEKLGISKYVIFHGKQHGNDLNNIFESCDFGIGSLGRHRVGITSIKTLKNREYAARGIPFIYSESDSDFDDKPYVLKTPADESPIDIISIVNFYRSLTISPSEIRKSINDLSWKNQMQKILDNI